MLYAMHAILLVTSFLMIWYANEKTGRANAVLNGAVAVEVTTEFNI